MNEQKNRNGRGIFYGVIGVATLVVAIIGATFAYFTATASAGNEITGNMASISFGVKVQKVTKADEELGGMIPMSNNMVEAALHGMYDGEHAKTDTGATASNYSKSNICTDDNGNAVCQVYKIVVNNDGSAGMFVDGYVSLTGGSGVPADAGGGNGITNKTTMRWAQAFCTGTDNQLTSCTTAGTNVVGGTINALPGSTDTSGLNNNYILTANNIKTGNNYSTLGDNTTAVASSGTINGNPYDIISTNYIRISDHTPEAGYQRTTDMTSALVLNQNIAAKTSNQATFATLDSSTSATSTDAKAYYIVVWLSENGHNQTPGVDPDGDGQQTANPAAASFFQGNVTFNSAQGSEVTATFSGYTAVPSDTVTPQSGS